MAASNSPVRTSSTDVTVDSGVGMDHLTVIPTNFDPDDSTATDD